MPKKPAYGRGNRSKCVSASEASNASCILVVEPHPTLRMVLAQRLRQDGHMTAAVASAAEAMQLCLDQQPDLLVSAELLEETTALKLGAQLRCPVMVLTARTGAEAVVSLLDSGAEGVLPSAEAVAGHGSSSHVGRSQLSSALHVAVDVVE